MSQPFGLTYVNKGLVSMIAHHTDVTLDAFLKQGLSPFDSEWKIESS